jgi:predicted acyltransferase
MVSMSKRLGSIDHYRGFSILLMILANYTADVVTIPPYLKHAPDIGLTVIDLIAPFFIFAIGLSYPVSARRRSTQFGARDTIMHFIQRGFVLLGIGALISAGESLMVPNGESVNWGVLQAIGIAILLTLPVILLPSGTRLIIGLGLLAVYQYLLGKYWLGIVLRSSHGGLPGSLGWTAMLILSTVFADVFHRQPERHTRYLWFSLITLLIGILLCLFVPISKNRVSASYILVSLGASALLFAGFHILIDHWNFNLAILDASGKNPLVLYCAHYVLLGLVVLPGIPSWHVEAPVWLVILQAVTLVTILGWFGWVLNQKGWYLKL